MSAGKAMRGELVNGQGYGAERLPNLPQPQPEAQYLPAEVDTQVATAHRFPRSVEGFKQLALSMATLDQETAAGCYYALPRDGKTISGPSVRLAEIVMSAWGNIRGSSKVVRIGDKDLSATGTCWDLERNVAIEVEIQRRITTKSGARFKDDMIVVTGNAACAIAFRNACFKVIPQVYTKAILTQCMRVAAGDEKTLSKRREDAFAAFAKQYKVPRERVLAAIGRNGIADVGISDLQVLLGMYNALRDGDSTPEEMFPDPKAKAPAARSLDDLTKAAEPEPPAEEDISPTEAQDLLDALDRDDAATAADSKRKSGQSL